MSRQKTYSFSVLYWYFIPERHLKVVYQHVYEMISLLTRLCYAWQLFRDYNLLTILCFVSPCGGYVRRWKSMFPGKSMWVSD